MAAQRPGVEMIEEVAAAVHTELPWGWEVVGTATDDELRLECQHVVLGGHLFHWPRTETDSIDGLTAEVLERLAELGLVEASRRMPPLTDAETETLREAHAVVSTADVSKEQARNIVGLTHSLRQVSDDAVDWAIEALDLLEDWHGFATGDGEDARQD